MTRWNTQQHSLRLGPFLKDVQTRLDTLSHEQLKARLIAHARSLVPQKRRAFLEILEWKSPPSDSERPQDVPPLLDDVDGFIQSLKAGDYYEGWGWDEDLLDERAWGDESWVETMDELFDGAGAAFLEGDRRLAADAYGRLLKAFHHEDDVTSFCGPESPEEMVTTDLEEAKARYLRALYETTAPEERPGKLAAEMEDLHGIGEAGGLEAMEHADETPLPDFDLFLPAWVEVLKSRKSDEVWGWEPTRKSLLREAVAKWDGVEGLARLAREEGDQHPEAYAVWVEALVRAGDRGTAIAAAREGVERIVDADARAEQADTLAELAAAEGQVELALEARHGGWRASSTLRRLLALMLEGDPDSKRLEARMAVELRDLKARRFQTDGQLAVVLFLLAGDYGSAFRRLSRAKPVGWSHHDHPGPVVFPFLVLAGSGASIPAEGTSMEHLWTGLAPGQMGSPFYLWRSSHPDAGGSPELAGSDPLDHFLPLLRGVLDRHPVSEKQQPRFLKQAQTVAAKRVRAIVSGKHRRAYERAARLAVACAEAQTLAGREQEGMGLLRELLAEFPRHVAFRREMNALIKASPLLAVQDGR